LTKDVNRKIRNQAFEIIANLTSSLYKQNLFNEWVYHLVSKLSSDDTYIVSSAINSIARAFWELRDEEDTLVINQLTQCYYLINEKLNEKTGVKLFTNNKEVTKSIFLFFRVM
jgi:hypothetical protein